MKPSNQLIHSTSPYLLQHAHNPVNWYPWSDAVFQKAMAEDKLVLVSIGYSACHWCHVMEHESFENQDVAAVMNDFFVCIKVDREERPDIDQVYMAAVQLMTGRGGWPLNCITLPDGRPVYGGTYFPRDQWVSLLQQLAAMYRNDKQKMLEYAHELTTGVKSIDGLPAGIPVDITEAAAIAKRTVSKWLLHFDSVEGGPDHAPKFPLPNNYIYLLAYAEREQDAVIREHIRLTLRKMAWGGIYDQLGGGFCRYSVDEIWKVPHFEKMLYDNAQLVSLYSLAFKAEKLPLYKETVYQTLDFINHELTGPQGNFFSALDADSEGVEGKFYVWTKDEITTTLGEDAELFASCYNVNDHGLWEHGNHILLRTETAAVVAEKYKITEAELKQRIETCIQKLLTIRNLRVRPGLDDKTLTSWNGLMMCGYLDAYDAFEEPRFLEAARINAGFIYSKLVREDGGLWHTWKGVASVNGYLEDYAFVVQAFIRLYQCTFDRTWLDRARDLCLYAMDHFSDDTSPFFYFTSDLDPPLYTRKFEMQDNVIPASNSQMAMNVYLLGRYYDRESWIKRAKDMWEKISCDVEKYGSAYSNWLLLSEYFTRDASELVICGERCLDERRIFAKRYNPFVILAGSEKPDDLPLLKGRVPATGTAVYRCINNTCGLPASSVDAAFEN
jgi:uncharacterized protein YyaL (SSP411 family)